jgi:phage-related protein
MSWIVEFLDKDVQALLDALPEDMQAHFLRIVEIIQSHGLEQLREPYVKHLEDKLWEMRLKGRSGIARAVYVTAIGRRVVVVHVFKKKTEKTPRHEIEMARKRAREVL